MTFTNQHYSPTVITQAKPAVVTIAAHGLSNGQRLRASNFYTLPFAVATGMEQLNNDDFVVQQVTTNTFELWTELGQPVDSTNYTAFTGNGNPVFTLVGPLLNYENEA